MKEILNTMKLELDAKSENESFARTTVAAFATQLDPTVDEINDLKTAVSEAVTNCIVHANTKKILIECALFINNKKDRVISVTVTDFGIGIANIEKALEPFFTTKPEQERSGMGFTVMQSFMDTVTVQSNCRHMTVGEAHSHMATKAIGEKPHGTIVEMTKVFGV